jgi:hypothetical protein
MKKMLLYAGAAIAGGVLLYALVKRKPNESLGEGLGRAAAGAVGDFGVGAVKGIGSFVGIPDTDETQCDRDLAAGRTWDASFSCPAGRFVTGVFNSTTARDAEINDARQIDRIIERQQAAVAGLGGVYNYETGEQVGAYDEMGNRIY